MSVNIVFVFKNKTAECKPQALVFRKVERMTAEDSLEFCGIQPTGDNELTLLNMKAEVADMLRRVLCATLGKQNVSFGLY